MTATSFIDSISAAAKTATDSVKSKKEDPQDRFLKLLVTQMKNQDPLNPLDNAEVTSQIAQISTVNGIEKLNTAIKGMGDSMLAAQSLQASAMIGRSVLASGNRLELANGGAVGGIDLNAAAAKVVVTIYGPSGEAIEAIDLGKREAGLSTFAWDGRPDGATQLPDGAYQFKVDALSGTGAKIEGATLGLGRVQSVSLDGGVTLNVSNLGAVPVASVRQII